jgi:hypothetical protein
MTGLKYTISTHSVPIKDKWSATAKTHKKALIKKLMQELIAQLGKRPGYHWKLKMRQNV